MEAIHVALLIGASLSGLAWVLQSCCVLMAWIALSLGIHVQDYKGIIRLWWIITIVFTVFSAGSFGTLGFYRG